MAMRHLDMNHGEFRLECYSPPTNASSGSMEFHNLPQSGGRSVSILPSWTEQILLEEFTKRRHRPLVLLKMSQRERRDQIPIH